MVQRDARPAPEHPGDIVREMRLARGWTLESLAAKADVSLRSLSDLERNVTTRAYTDTLQKIASAFSVPVEHLDPARIDLEKLAAKVTRKAKSTSRREAVMILLELPESDMKSALAAIRRIAGRRRRETSRQ
jgi:transcriptional regulator with XRE-family HTH domain